MATGKRYYWIKLKESFMTSDTVDYFMSQADGANYVVLYQMLCLKTINTEGRLSRQIGEIIIPYDIEKIQRDCKWFTVDTIRVALNLYKSFGLIYEDKDGVLALADFENIVGSETDYAAQKKLQRQNQQQQLPTHTVDIGVDNVHIENRDKILDTRYKTLDKNDNYILITEGDQDTLASEKNASKRAQSASKKEQKNSFELEFETIWSLYPRKIGKAKALGYYLKARSEGVEYETIKQGVENYAKDCKIKKIDTEYIKHGSTWFNSKGWNDEYDMKPYGSHKPISNFTNTSFDPKTAWEKAIKRTEEWIQSGKWENKENKND